MLKDTKDLAENSDDGLTAHGYGKNEDYSAGPIDYVFVSEGIKVDTYKIIRNTAKNMYPSDHYPVVADVIF